MLHSGRSEMSDDLDRKRLEDELRHYKAQLAGKLGRLRIMLGSRYLRPDGVYWPYYEGEVGRLAREMGHIGLKYLALQERMEG